MLNGWDTLTFAALAAGVRAVIWGAASILPEQCVALHRLLIDADRPARRTRPVDPLLHPLCSFLEAHSYSAAVKAGCAIAGDAHRPVRAPLLALDDGDARESSARLIEHARAGGRARGRLRRPWTLAYASALLSHGPSR